MNSMTTDEMIAYLQKAMKEKHHKDWLGRVSQNKVFKLKLIDIDSVAPADGLELDQDKIDYMAKGDLSNAPIIVVHKNGSIIDGNHRHQALKKQGAKTVQAYIGEGKMDFQLIDTEDLSEARIFRTTNNFKNLEGKDIADLLYLTSLSIYLMYKDDKQYDYARSYAKQSVQYGPYTLFRSHATDLYMLAHVCNSMHRKNFNFKKNSESQRFLGTLNFNNRTHWNFFNKLKSGMLNDTEAHPYFFRLESQLKISDSRYKQWRRLLMDWENLRYRQRQYVTTNILQEYRRKARGSEMVTTLSTMVKYKKYGVSDKFSKKPYKKSNATGKFLGTVAGAAAGRYAGKKIAQKLGKNVDKYKKVGTGLGAIAGYWAGGRQRQK